MKFTPLRLALLLLVLAIVWFLSGCGAPVQRHQRGGASAQTLGAPALDVGRPLAGAPITGAPRQSMTQPENPEGQSQQEMSRTTTTTHADGSVTTTREVAKTVIGGSQSLTDILKAYAAGEYMRRIAIALIMGLVAWLMRKEWPLIAGVLAIGALVVAFFGPGYALAFAGAGAGIYVAYHVVRAQLTGGLSVLAK